MPNAFERFAQNRRRAGREQHEYWFLAFVSKGKPFVWRLENVHSEREARLKASEKLMGNVFTVFSESNSDMSEATRHGKALLVELTSNADESVGRASHREEDYQPEDGNI